VPPLAELQADMVRALLGGDPGPVAALIHGGRLAPEGRLAIHRNNITGSLTAALRATYPALCRLVDERFFAYAAHTFVRRCPPVGPCLDEYGEGFGAFLSGFKPCADLPWLEHLARFEWLQGSALRDDIAAPMGRTAIGSHAAVGATATLRLQPSLRLMVARWPVDELWRIGMTMAEASQLTMPVDGPVHLALWRDGDDVAFRRLEPAEYAFVEELAAGTLLGGAVDDALAVDPLFDLALALRRLIRDRLLTGIEPINSAGVDHT
jgi:hypothetical protein